MTGLNIVPVTSQEFDDIDFSKIENNVLIISDDNRMYLHGNIFGKDTQMVAEFPLFPVPNTIYIKESTMEQRMWTNNQWYNLRENIKPLSNTQIDRIINDIMKGLV